MNIGIIGYGVVGKAATLTFEKEYNVLKYDKFQKLDNFNSLLVSDFVFIMVPTPFDCESNRVDISAVKESLDRLQSLGFKNTVVIKSTVPPGTCSSLSQYYDYEIAFNPEFLRESTTPNEDFAEQETIVIGTEKTSTFDSVKKMYEKVAVAHASYYHTSRSEAEMIKTAQNTMLASRVALANMIFDACDDNNISYKKVREIAFDRFDILGPHMVQVPGPDGLRGFGGKCLPKDIRAFSTISKSQLLSEIISYNDRLRNDLDKVLKNFNVD